MELTRARPAVIFLINVIAATVVPPIIAVFGAWTLLRSLHLVNPGFSAELHNIVFKQGFPLQTLLAVPLGFANSAYFKSRILLWTWVVPALALIFAIATFHPDSVLISFWNAVKVRFFGEECPPPWCMVQMFTTLPLCSSVGFTVGVLLEKGKVFTFSSAHRPETDNSESAQLDDKH